MRAKAKEKALVGPSISVIVQLHRWIDLRHKSRDPGSARRDDAQTLRQNFIETLRLVNAVSPLRESARRDQLACVYVAR